MSTQTQTVIAPYARHLPKTRQSLLSRLFDEMDEAMGKARLRSDLRRRLRLDANIRRDIGVTRFEMLQMTDRP